MRAYGDRLEEMVKDAGLVKDCRSCCTEDVDDAGSVKAASASAPRPACPRPAPSPCHAPCWRPMLWLLRVAVSDVRPGRVVPSEFSTSAREKWGHFRPSRISSTTRLCTPVFRA
jgi:hypothetical protein